MVRGRVGSTPEREDVHHGGGGRQNMPAVVRHVQRRVQVDPDACHARRLGLKRRSGGVSGWGIREEERAAPSMSAWDHMCQTRLAATPGSCPTSMPIPPAAPAPAGAASPAAWTCRPSRSTRRARPARGV
jgi:hypothetical protein